METLCNLYVAEKNKAEKEKILRELMRFTYFQCQHKMLQRFNIKLHPFCSESFHGVFRPDAISNFELSSRFEEDNAVGITPKMLRYNESKLLGSMKKLTGYTFTADEKQKIILDKISTPHFHRFVGRVIKFVIDGLDDLAGFKKRRTRGVNKQAMILQATAALDDIESGLDILGDLVNRSPTFRKHMNHPSIQR